MVYVTITRTLLGVVFHLFGKVWYSLPVY